MIRRLIFAIVLCVLLPACVYGIGGDRKGFTLGLGAGISPATLWEPHAGTTEHKVTPLTATIVGWGFGKRNALLMEGISSFFERYDSNSILFASTIRWYHYFKPGTPSQYFSIGISTTSFKKADALFTLGFGGYPGFAVGYGCEFGNRWVASADLSWTTRGDGTKMVIAGLLVKFIAY